MLAGMQACWPEIRSPQAPPIMASGIAIMMVIGLSQDLKVGTSEK